MSWGFDRNILFHLQNEPWAISNPCLGNVQWITGRLFSSLETVGVSVHWRRVSTKLNVGSSMLLYFFGAPRNHVDLSYLSTENPNNHKLMNWMNYKDDNNYNDYTICFNFPPLTHCVALWTGDLQNSYTLFKVQPTWIHSLFQAAYISFMLPFLHAEATRFHWDSY